MGVEVKFCGVFCVRSSYVFPPRSNHTKSFLSVWLMTCTGVMDRFDMEPRRRLGYGDRGADLE